MASGIDFEKLGSFYLGAEVLGESGRSPEPLLYDSKDLTTHALCVGMTGSGKTGLCLSLLEEAAIDGIPAIAIDPKGDLGNLLLTFPDLEPRDFRPWVDERVAEQKGLTPDAFAEAEATKWRAGLAQWNQDGERIRRMRESVDLCIYTPGSAAGRSLSILHSFQAPGVELDDDAHRERVSSAASSLLALLGIAADPIKSREHILLANLFDRAWRNRENLDLGSLIVKIQDPGIDKIGVMALDDFYPAKERRELATTLNNLLASPSFAGWLEGEPLSIKNMLWNEQGKPKISIISIAHLSDTERMFFVTLLLNEMVAWMRGQAGTSSLRALLYMDEVFGFFPPTANPPAKVPMLRLLKQARAFGLGIVLATQNPVDLDYKGLSNTGTWFLGRLQTKRDIERVIDGLEGASAEAGKSFDRQSTEALLAGLKSRVFLMNNVHEAEPVLFQTRWALSYLRGPLTRTQIKALNPEPSSSVPSSGATPAPTTSSPVGNTQSEVPVVEDGVPVHFAPGNAPTYYPTLFAKADLHYASSPLDIDQWDTALVSVDLRTLSGRSPWKTATSIQNAPELGDSPAEGASFSDLPRAASKAKSYATWAKSLKAHLYREFPLLRYSCKKLKLVSEPGESEADFRIRVTERAREVRDEKLEKLRDRYATKVQRVQDQIARQEDKVEVQEEQLGQAKLSASVSVGSTVLGALFGRKLASRSNVGKAASSIRRAGKVSKEKEDVQRAEARLDELEDKLAALEIKIAADLEKASELTHPSSYEVVTKLVRPKKADLEVGELALVWMPVL